MLPPGTIPVRTVTWREEEGIVVVLAPRWGKGFLCRFLARLLFLSPTVRLPLDEFGSRVWKLCDGTRTVETIVETVRKTHTEGAESVDALVVRYLEGLGRQDWIRFYKDFESIPMRRY